MRLICKFKSLDWSQSLVEYAEDRFMKIGKFEMKPVRVHMTISKEGRMPCTEVIIHGSDSVVHAKAKSDDFYASVDMCLAKVIAQMAKKKSKIQRHKNYQQSHLGRLERTNDQLEYEQPEHLAPIPLRIRGEHPPLRSFHGALPL